MTLLNPKTAYNDQNRTVDFSSEEKIGKGQQSVYSSKRKDQLSVSRFSNASKISLSKSKLHKEIVKNLKREVDVQVPTKKKSKGSPKVSLKWSQY